MSGRTEKLLASPLRRNCMRSLLLGAMCLLCVSSGQGTEAAEREVAVVEHNGPVSFEQEILPILTRNCLACHNTTKPESELNLETPQLILKGGSQGPAVVPGKPDESLLLAVTTHREEPIMPPEGNAVGARDLTPVELGLIKLWIAEGAQGTVTGNGASIVWQLPPPERNPIYAAVMTADGRYVAAGRANQVDLYNVPGRSLIAQLVDDQLTGLPEAAGRTRAHLDMVESLAFSPDGEILASGSYREVKFWRRPHQFEETLLAGDIGEVTAMRVSPSRSLVAVGFGNGQVRIFDLEQRQWKETVWQHDGGVTALQFTVDGQLLVSAGRDGVVRIGSLQNFQVTGGFSVAAPITTMAMSAEHQLVVVGLADGILQAVRFPALADTAPASFPAGEVEHSTPVSSAGVTGLALVNSSGTRIVSGSEDGSARLWEAATLQQIKSFEHGAPIVRLAAWPDGNRLATASANGVVKLWNVESGELIAEIDELPELHQGIEDARYQIEVAQREASSCATDLAASMARLQEERAIVDANAIEVTKAEIALQAKTAPLESLAAAKEKAEQEWNARKTEFDQAVAKVKELEEHPPLAEDEAAKTEHQTQLAAVQTMVTDLKAKLEAAEKEKSGTAAAYAKANDERVIASIGVETSKRAAAGAAALVDQTAATVQERSEKLKAAEAAVVSAQIEWSRRELAARTALLAVADLRGEQAVLASEAGQVRGKLSMKPATAEEMAAAAAPATSELTVAVEADVQAEKQWREARQEQRGVAERVQLRVAAINYEKAAVEKRVTAVTTQLQILVAARDAAAQPIAELEKKLQEAADEPAKLLAQVELQNAQQRRGRLVTAVDEAEKSLAELQATKAHLESELAVAEAESKSGPEAAAVSVNDAQTRRSQTREALRQLDLSYGGHQAVLNRIERALAEVGKLLAVHSSPVQLIEFSPNGNRLLVARSSGVRFYSGTDGAVLDARAAVDCPMLLGAFVNDREMIAIDPDQTLKRIDVLPVWKLERQLGGVSSSMEFAGPVTSLDFSPDGTVLATGGGETSRIGEIKLWDVATGSLLRVIESPHSDLVLGLKFSPDGRFLASGGADRHVKIFDVATGNLLKVLEGHSHHVLAVSWRSDGRLLVSAAADKTCKVWNVEKGEAVQSLTGYTKEVTSVQFLGTTDSFVTSSGAVPFAVIRKVDGATGTPFPGVSDYLYCVTASRNGQKIAAGGMSSVLHLWNDQGVSIVDFSFPAQSSSGTTPQ